MAYHLTGFGAFKKAIQRRLTPVEGGLHYTATTDITSEDALGSPVNIQRGTGYKITGTSDGNGYVVTILDGSKATYYLEAEEGCKLC